MNCAWDLFLKLLPQWMRTEVDNLAKSNLQELRLRIHQLPELVTSQGALYLDHIVLPEDIQYCVNVATQYSPWTARTMERGYITAPGGHRIGLCGQAIMDGAAMKGLSSIQSLNIRVARDFPGVAAGAQQLKGSILIIGPPGTGKTTLLRDLIRLRANCTKRCVGVVDEKGELFPLHGQAYAFNTGEHTDILSFCGKSQGIECLLRNMGVHTIAVDEITAATDCQALASAAWCGVELLATAHATDRQDLYRRRVYEPILQQGLFSHLLILRRDKTWRRERMDI